MASFLYGRTFLSDADLNAQLDHWLASVANPRIHGTTGAVPAVRFATEEQPQLQPLPARAYQSLVLTPRPAPTPTPRSLPAIVVERRSLRTYAALVGAES